MLLPVKAQIVGVSVQVAFDQSQIATITLNGNTINSFRWELLQQQPLLVNIFFIAGTDTKGTVVRVV